MNRLPADPLRRVGDYGVRLLSRGLASLIPGGEPASVVLCLHRLTATPDVPTWSVRAEQLERMLVDLLDRGYQPLRHEQLLGFPEQSLPRKGLLVTFDDGYASVHDQALPVLRQLHVPATVFLTTGYIGSDRPFPFDDWKTPGSPSRFHPAQRPLNLTECRALQESGWVQFGCHTHRHLDFRNRPDELALDLSASLAWLKQNLGLAEVPFAFPFGSSHLGYCDSRLVEVVRQHGMTSAYTTDPSFVTPASDPFCLGRFLVYPDDSVNTLRGRLNAWYPPARRWASAMVQIMGGNAEACETPGDHLGDDRDERVLK